MKTKSRISSPRSRWAATLLAVTAAGALSLGAHAAGKGNGGNVGGDVSGWIFVNVVFDNHYLGVEANGANGLLSDGAPYLDGSQSVQTRIGRNRNILMDLNTQDKKAAIRKFKIQNVNELGQASTGFPALKTCSAPNADCPPVPAPDSTTPFFCSISPQRPTLPANGLVPNSELTIFGEDHDDTPVECSRHVSGRMWFTDASGVKWWLFFGMRTSAGGSAFSPCSPCLTVTRLSDVVWEFHTVSPHTVYLYRDNQPPNFPSEFFGRIRLPFSGIMSSQTIEPTPTAECASFTDSGPCL